MQNTFIKNIYFKIYYKTDTLLLWEIIKWMNEWTNGKLKPNSDKILILKLTLILSLKVKIGASEGLQAQILPTLTVMLNLIPTSPDPKDWRRTGGYFTDIAMIAESEIVAEAKNIKWCKWFDKWRCRGTLSVTIQHLYHKNSRVRHWWNDEMSNNDIVGVKHCDVRENDTSYSARIRPEYNHDGYSYRNIPSRK